MLMTPGLRLFYGGMVRKWILYFLAFDPDNPETVYGGRAVEDRAVAVPDHRFVYQPVPL